MTLSEWLSKDGNTSLALAKAVGVSHSTILRYATGEITVPGERAVQIEDATDGAIKCHEMRPDLWPKRRAA